MENNNHQKSITPEQPSTNSMPTTPTKKLSNKIIAIMILLVIVSIVMGISIPKFFITGTFSDIYDPMAFKCFEDIENSKNKLIVMNSSFGNDPNNPSGFIERDYTYFGIKLKEYPITCQNIITQVQSTSTPTIVSGWQNYKNEKYSFELQYPIEWRILEQDYADCENKDCLYQGSYLPLTYGQNNSKFILLSTFCLTLAHRTESTSCEMELYISKDVTRFASGENDFLGFPIADSPTIVAGKFAKSYAKGQLIQNIFIQKDGLIYLFTLPVTTEVTLEQFNRILSTFKFLEPPL